MYPHLESPFALPALDPDLLTLLLGKIATTHFRSKGPAAVRWGIPRTTTVRRVIKPHDKPLPELQQKTYEHALALVAGHRLTDAARLLQPLADQGHAESEQLMSHLLKRLDGNWQAYAQRYSERFQTLQIVPASSHNPVDDSITLHSYLAHRKAPRFVLSYLIYHECARRLHNVDPDGPPTPRFLACERNAPHRDKALEWLSRHGFPVFRLEPIPTTV